MIFLCGNTESIKLSGGAQILEKVEIRGVNTAQRHRSAQKKPMLCSAVSRRWRVGARTSHWEQSPSGTVRHSSFFRSRWECGWPLSGRLHGTDQSNRQFWHLAECPLFHLWGASNLSRIFLVITCLNIHLFGVQQLIVPYRQGPLRFAPWQAVFGMLR